MLRFWIQTHLLGWRQHTSSDAEQRPADAFARSEELQWQFFFSFFRIQINKIKQQTHLKTNQLSNWFYTSDKQLKKRQTDLEGSSLLGTRRKIPRTLRPQRCSWKKEVLLKGISLSVHISVFEPWVKKSLSSGPDDPIIAALVDWNTEESRVLVIQTLPCCLNQRIMNRELENPPLIFLITCVCLLILACCCSVLGAAIRGSKRIKVTKSHRILSR